MLLNDALTHAIEFIRATTEDPTLLCAAKEIERKVSRTRARTERLPHESQWCECGEMKPSKQVACSACYRLIPMSLLIDQITGKLKDRRKAERQILLICQTRMTAETFLAA